MFSGGSVRQQNTIYRKPTKRYNYAPQLNTRALFGATNRIRVGHLRFENV